MRVGVLALGVVVGAAGLVSAATGIHAAQTPCSSRVTILESPRQRSLEVQAKALNDRGDVKVVALKTVRGRADGIAEGTNRAGMTVGYLGTLGTRTEPESDQGAVWRTPAAEPLLLGAAQPNVITELVDVNERGQAAGMRGTFNPRTGFTLARPVIWRAGWTRVRPLPVPAASRANRVLATSLNDINNRGAVVGNVFGLTVATGEANRLRSEAAMRVLGL